MSEMTAPVTGKKLLFVTGTRADFGKLEPLARAAQQAGFEISFFITGMHMMKQQARALGACSPTSGV